jgi:2-polyprenyl-3-methyl-5-hydroxy-6-metoxy-1,4-benzoquinol methylase
MASEIRMACLVCGSTKIKSMEGEYARAQLKKCRNCGFVFAGLEPDDQELMAHYAQYPRERSISWVTEKRYVEILSGFAPFRKSNRIFDFGCGSGHFLKVAMNHGWEPYGCEYDEPARSACRDKGVSVFSTDTDLTSFYGTFDIVTSFEVLEHLKQPGPSVRLAFDLLRPGGAFYFTTPNFNAISRRLLGASWRIISFPEHLCYFTPKTINRLIQSYGFEKRYIQTTGVTIASNLTSINNGRVSVKDSARFEQSIRERSEKKKLYGLAKHTVNLLLNSCRAGDTIKGLYVKKA